MQILKLKGFLFEPSDPAVYDRDSKTVLELCGRLGYKINELIDEYNRFYDEMIDKYNEAYDYMVTHIDESVREQLALVVAEQLPAVASEIMQELYGEDIEQILSDLAGLKSVGRLYPGIDDLKENGQDIPVGSYVNTLFYSTLGDEGGATYLIVDELEEGEVADDETIIKIDDVDLWAKLQPGEIIKTSSFLTLQKAIDFAYENNRDVLVIGNVNSEDITIPCESDNQYHTIKFIGKGANRSTLDIEGSISIASGASCRNFAFENLTLHQSSGWENPIIGDLPTGIIPTLNVFFKNCEIANANFSFTSYTNNMVFEHCYFRATNVYFEYGSNIIFENCQFYTTSEAYFNFPLHFKNSGYITINNSNIKSVGCGKIIEFDTINNLTFTNSLIGANNITANPIYLADVTDSNFENILINGDPDTIPVNTIEMLNGYNVTFKNISDKVEYGLYTFNLTNSQNVNIDSVDSLCSIVNATSTSSVKLKNYENLRNQTIYNGGTKSDVVELKAESDLAYVTTNATISIPSETKSGDTTTQNSLTTYEGRVFYNTQTNEVNLYTNGAWVTFGGGSASTPQPIKYMEATGGNFEPNNIANTINATDKATLLSIIQEVYSEGFTAFILVLHETWQGSSESLVYNMSLQTSRAKLNFRCMGAQCQIVDPIGVTMNNFYVNLTMVNDEITNMDNYVGGGGRDQGGGALYENTCTIDLTNSSLLLGPNVQAFATNPAKAYRMGKFVHIQGGIIYTSTTATTLNSLQIYISGNLRPSTSSSAFYRATTTSLYVKSSNPTARIPIFTEIRHTANQSNCYLYFNEMDVTSSGSITVEQNDVIYLDITYIVE